jgi:hypothetical protein
MLAPIVFLATATASKATSSTVSVNEPSRVAAERLVYGDLDQALDFVGATHVTASGALTWLSIAGDDSGTISCQRLSAGHFRCHWSAKLIQTYKGSVRVIYQGPVRRMSFTTSCKNPSAKGVSYPDLCAIDPVPGMPGY